MKTLLAVSPHLDDAVFSAGAMLAHAARDGWRVVVATCFTATVADPTGFALACQLDKGLGPDVDYMALRRAEDRAACAHLGAEPLHLAFAEAPHRGYDSAPALFGALLPGDGIAEPLGAALRDLVATLRPALLLGPAAIGDHVDHVIVRRILESTPAPRARLWADLPYAARTGFERAGFTPTPCNERLRIKADAAACYASQTGFQFRDGPMTDLLHIDGAEWTCDA